jgi:riboflavin synthase
MFTGIVEELARVKKIKTKKKGIRYTISANTVLDDLEIGDSICINGVCLTVTKRQKDMFSMDIIEETLDKSNLGELKENDYVNLERAMKVSDRFGGHIVQGHVETQGVILEKQIEEDEARISVCLDHEWMRYCIPKGSITLDGVSLTIASINSNIIEIALIPHTLENTTLGLKDKSDTLNVETDIIGKYINRLLTFDGDNIEFDKNILKTIRHIQYDEN